MPPLNLYPEVAHCKLFVDTDVFDTLEKGQPFRTSVFVGRANRRLTCRVSALDMSLSLLPGAFSPDRVFVDPSVFFFFFFVFFFFFFFFFIFFFFFFLSKAPHFCVLEEKANRKTTI